MIAYLNIVLARKDDHLCAGVTGNCSMSDVNQELREEPVVTISVRED